jgi:hypothetical protein
LIRIYQNLQAEVAVIEIERIGEGIAVDNLANTEPLLIE